MSAQPDHAPVTPYAPEPGAPAELLAQLRADARAAQWVPAFEREWAAALEESRRTFSLAGPITVKRITGHANLLGKRMRDHLRRCAFVLGEQHGIR
ncbi:DUF6247 family protein [Streptomyces olivaceoviridis]|uniref:DUF6247 family protein n=1 Tax=Streptomyces olivaceoviridis TaxID=1921 RepID=UPI003689CAD4